MYVHLPRYLPTCMRCMPIYLPTCIGKMYVHLPKYLIFQSGLTPASFFLFSFFSTTILQKSYRAQRDLNSDCQSRWQACWPLDHRHSQPDLWNLLLPTVLFRRDLKQKWFSTNGRWSFLLSILIIIPVSWPKLHPSIVHMNGPPKCWMSQMMQRDSS